MPAYRLGIVSAGGEIEETLLPLWKGPQSLPGAFVLSALRPCLVQALSADAPDYTQSKVRSVGSEPTYPQLNAFLAVFCAWQGPPKSRFGALRRARMKKAGHSGSEREAQLTIPSAR